MLRRRSARFLRDVAGIAGTLSDFERLCGRLLRLAHQLSTIAELRVPILAASLGSHVEHGPHRADVGPAAGVLALVRHLAGHRALPEQADLAAVLPEHGHDRVLPAFLRIEPAEVERERVADGLRELEMRP